MSNIALVTGGSRSSGATRFCIPGYSVYSSLKVAVEVFTKHVAKEYGTRGIRSNVVAPGPIETDFNDCHQ